MELETPAPSAVACSTETKTSAMSPPSLFERLPYDIRYIIWGYLPLPPMSIECVGLMYSCREAKEEIEEAAVRQFNAYLKTWKRETELVIPGHSLCIPEPFPKDGFAKLKKITITVPSKVLRRSVRSEFNLKLFSLLGGYFDKVTVLYHTPNPPGHSDKWNLSSAEFFQRMLLKAIRTGFTRNGFARKGFTCKDRPIKTKEIEVQWDVPRVDRAEVWLRTVRYFEYSKHRKESLTRMHSLLPSYPWPKIEWGSIEGSHFNASQGCQVGFLRFTSGTRWTLLEGDFDELMVKSVIKKVTGN